MRVKIKTWNEMSKEFSLNEKGELDLGKVLFSKEMESLLPENRIISIAENRLSFDWFPLDEDFPFDITDEMIDFSYEDIDVYSLTKYNQKINMANEINVTVDLGIGSDDFIMNNYFSKSELQEMISDIILKKINEN